MPRIGIIGGSGLYGIEGFEDKKWVHVNTPFGNPSDEYLIGKLNGEEIAFLPRHGRGHTVLPSQLNYRANIFGMKKLGVEHLISFSAVGSFRKEIKPLDLVIIDQFVDRTNQARRMTFFGDGIVAHVSFAEPICPVLSDLLYETARKLKVRNPQSAIRNSITVHKGGTYLNIEGPAFSTEAESFLYKSWGMDVIGMTNMPEAKLAREAEICFATVAMVTDYDAWHEEESVVTIDMVIQNLNKNVKTVKELIQNVIPHIPKARNCLCGSALKNAIITQKELISDEKREEMDLLVGKYINL